jgi:hypothetical protein
VEAIVGPFGVALKVDLLYAPVQSDGWDTEPGPITVAEPVHPAFTSWTGDPMRPLAALAGVGVEDDLALGVAEYLDVSNVYAFVPIGGDPGFDELNEAANFDCSGSNGGVATASRSFIELFEHPHAGTVVP